MPDLDALSEFALRRNHNLTGKLLHEQVEALARCGRFGQNPGLVKAELGRRLA
jgi:hypothetical protein